MAFRDESSPAPCLDSVRNIGILAHVDAGKTSITERILQLAGVKQEAGAVDEGTTSTDYLTVERAHGITIKSAAVRFIWNDRDIHLIDTPGHVDFGSEVDRALRILDGAVIALCAVSGVQARTETISLACRDRGLPRLYFINKMDRAGADFQGVLANLRERLEPAALPVQWPLFVGQKWAGYADLREPRVRATETTASPETAVARNLLLERLAEIDDSIMEYFIKDADPPRHLVDVALRRAVVSGEIVPVLCGSAFDPSSVAALLDAVVDCLPSPESGRRVSGTDPRTGKTISLDPDPRSPLSAFVFKTRKVSSGEVFAWTRIWSGSLRSGSKVYDARSGKDLGIRNVYGIHADELIDLGQGSAGDVVALKVSGAEPGASLCSRSHPVVFESLEVPEPVVRRIVEPSSSEDRLPLRAALESLAVEDSALILREEKETGRFEIAGQGELHLDVVVERLKKDFGLKLRTGLPRVNLRERLARSVFAREDFDRDFGGERVRLSLAVELSPIKNDDRREAEYRAKRDEVFPVETAAGLRISPNHLEAVRRGISSALSSGPIEGWPLEPVLARLSDFSPPPTATGRNGELACEAAAAIAVRKALLEAGAILLEPVMRVDIECPEAYFGAALGALSSRGARIESVEDRLSIKAISAAAPMAVLFGFATDLRSLCQGRAEFQAKFLGYEPASPQSRASH